MMGNAILSYGIIFLEFILIVEGFTPFSSLIPPDYFGMHLHHCLPSLSTLSLSNVSRDKQNNFRIKNLQNPFLVQCSPFMVPRYDVSSCCSWCDDFALNLKRPEFLEQCESKFQCYRPIKLEPFSGKGDLSYITKLITVQPCGPLRKRSFVIDIKICNCTDGVEERAPHSKSPYNASWWLNFGYFKSKSSKRTKCSCNTRTIDEPTNETPPYTGTGIPFSEYVHLAMEFCTDLYRVRISRGENAFHHAYPLFKTTIKNFKNVSSRDGQNRELRENVEFTTYVFEDFLLRFCQEQLDKTRDQIRYARDELDVKLMRVLHRHDKEFSVNDTKGNSIKIPAEDFKNNDSVLLGVMYKNIHELFLTERSKDNMTKKNRMLNTIIMSAVIYPRPKTLQENVTLVFKNLKPAKTENRQCVFWSYPENSPEGWSGEGCYASSVTISETVCVCNHLTHFAVLMDFTDSAPNLPRHDIEALQIITYAGLALSLLGNVITIICYLLLTDKHAPLSQIRVSLEASLLAGQITFLAGIGANENKGACVTVAAFTQYFFMVAFCWMLVEGIYLYLFVVKVYNVSHKMSMYHGMSWGVPAILVAISLTVAAGNGGVESFVSDRDCWLSSGSSGFGIFVSFVVLIGLVNVIILVRIIKEMASMQNTNDKQIEQVKFGIRACVVLIPLLGVTWLFGVLSPFHKAFIYMFVILNSTQIRARLKRRIQPGAFSSDFSKNRVKKSSHANQSTVNEVDPKDVIELQE